MESEAPKTVIFKLIFIHVKLFNNILNSKKYFSKNTHLLYILLFSIEPDVAEIEYP